MWEVVDSSFNAIFICCLKYTEPKFWPLEKVSLIALMTFRLPLLISLMARLMKRDL